MSQSSAIQAVSIGHALDVQAAEVGVVHSVFARAVNLMMRTNMWTLIAADKADLPFGIRVSLSNLDQFGLRSGDCVSVRSGFVGIGSSGTRLVVDCRTTPHWKPVCQDQLEPGLDRRLGVVAAAARSRSWCESASMARAVRVAVNDDGTLDEVVCKVIGRGPGATPAGDDVLVGILAVLASPYSGAAGAKAARLLGRRITPLLPTTTDIGAQLLRQATRGLFGRSVHDLITSLIGDPDPEQLSENIRRVIETGATSGADTCEGILAFAPSFLIAHDERAAA